jgi:hypothetical protein
MLTYSLAILLLSLPFLCRYFQRRETEYRRQRDLWRYLDYFHPDWLLILKQQNWQNLNTFGTHKYRLSHLRWLDAYLREPIDFYRLKAATGIDYVIWFHPNPLTLIDRRAVWENSMSEVRGITAPPELLEDNLLEWPEDSPEGLNQLLKWEFSQA